MNKNNMPRPHFCRGMDIANAEIGRLREAIKDRNETIEAVERENDSLREQNATLQATIEQQNEELNALSNEQISDAEIEVFNRARETAKRNWEKINNTLCPLGNHDVQNTFVKAGLEAYEAARKARVK